MRKISLLIALLLAAYAGQAQDCGPYIGLSGKGIAGENIASIEVEANGEITSIVAEVIYKSLIEPSQVKLWSSEEEFMVDPVDIPLSGVQGDGVITSVYRATFTRPADKINLDILQNVPDFYSMALYIHQADGTMVTFQEGELYHVFQNEDNPLVTNIPLELSDDPRDITLRFGVSELNEDERWAIFEFEAGGVTESLKIWEFDTSNGESDSYTIQEVHFDAVPGTVDNIVMKMMSDNYEGQTRTGDSYIAGIVLVDIPCEFEESEGYCSYTQGYYGNEGGKTCAGETTRELLTRLLDTDLVLGNENVSFTIPAGHVDCVIDILPGGGPSSVLSENATCENLNGIDVSKKGRIKNTLLAQGITFALNLRLSPDLMDFPVNDETFMIRQTDGCADPDATGIPGTEMEYGFGMEIVDYLGADATLADLLNLVNEALAGEDISPLHLSHVADAANLVNEAFDECVVILDYTDPDPDQSVGGENETGEEGEEDEKDNEDGKKGVTGVSDEESEDLTLYPNPASERFFISLSDGFNVNSAMLYTVTGTPVRNLLEVVHSAQGGAIEIDASDLMPGFYIIRIDTDTGAISKRFGIR